MKKIDKTVVVDTVQNAMSRAMKKLKLVDPSEKTKKAINKVSKQIQRDLKKQVDKSLKKSSSQTKKVVSKPSPAKKSDSQKSA